MIQEDNKKALYIITGATDAMGTVVTRRLAEQGHPIVMACYNTQRSDEVARELQIKTLNKNIYSLHLDLGSFAGVRDFVDELKKLNRPVAVLVNNASYISRKSEISPDGYEKLVQVNFLSTVLLSLLVKPLMVEGGRIIFTTSLSRHMVSLPYEFPAVNNFMPIAAFAQSKLALSLFSIYLSTVLRTQRISVNSVDPSLVSLSMVRMNRFFDKLDLHMSQLDKTEKGAQAMMRAINSSDTGFIFKGADKQIKASTLLKNREVFIKLCNDTMRIMKKQINAANQ
ncbi:MAG: SDR family NAD(P)-dependent oxidoreductase [Sodaliphilus pleomorphus]|jgi:NAD(P)-dependent dehydrogenase (short-subunit alcohol dehydrogenase family)|uniref:SDR family NAD(P)-dependent oxidoreductase n=1 Tax=Sodaliphilus pleomorphus TaxID=2606626 RepID=A0A6L5XDH0_9BACT|nr:SDR family NAD(P)-dependent oxidoreductase [Sodaliphilus pleomorphus]MCI6170013.1 SDR family NAD(P)-dependent oxidoreductase [Muribaculaceae bacterium]MDY6252604.1 SDR family NAD(P)-dependent oxidoreductase [Bacteroidales bacterium]MDD6475696.1 SDR family NAD(P)-dependent oxidoreductase [Sodaliphilus pleomorphus]MDD6686760.1 SDR family NAD(P)-dependent oxidoreductase [Sodaliphilus pleomorphus]MDD7067109.1 SDR family NAD(P)-dependent oxidoreductase [Sodaliphilus pleomorphus]